MVAVAPVIAITQCRVLADYVESIRRVGVEPRALDLAVDEPREIARTVDGVLLTGGADIGPERYGESPHETVTHVSQERDAFEIALVRCAREIDLPVLGLCRGIQLLNVAFGGTLIQDIPSQVPTALEHSVDDLLASAHEVWITPQSRLGALMSDGQDGGTGDLELARLVNSRHHQAVKRVAEGFVTSATAPDGIVEAIEQPESRFCVGVQWHPENFWRTGDFRSLFEGFVRACERIGR